jgi:hypothetical protein
MVPLGPRSNEPRPPTGVGPHVALVLLGGFGLGQASGLVAVLLLELRVALTQFGGLLHGQVVLFLIHPAAAAQHG